MRLLAQTAAAVLFSLLTACGSASMEDLKTEATAAFQSGDYDAALAAANSALDMANEAGADRVAKWNIEDLRLQILAGMEGKVDDVLDTLERLGEDYSEQIGVDRFIAVAHTMKHVSIHDATSIMEQAKNDYPESVAKIDALGNELVLMAKESGDPETLKLLESLGYVGN